MEDIKAYLLPFFSFFLCFPSLRFCHFYLFYIGVDSTVLQAESCIEALERATATIEDLEIRTIRSILDFISTDSARDRNQQRQKEAVRAYYGCIDASDHSKTICMVTGVSGECHQVVNSHIILVETKTIMSDFGLLNRNI